MIFVNLPVQDLPASREFFGALGYTFNEQFSDDNAACLVISDTIFAMLLKTEFFKTFVPGRDVSDTGKAVEVSIGLSATSRKAVDALADKALAAGGRKVREPDDQGFMYGRSFGDLDGHVWEVLWMDVDAIAKAG